MARRDDDDDSNNNNNDHDGHVKYALADVLSATVVVSRGRT